MKPQTLALYVLSVILTILLVVYIVLNLDWDILQSAFANLRAAWLALALSVYFVNIALRALRFKNLVYSRTVTARELLPIVSLHNMFMYLMPAKSGDISFIFLSRGRLKTSLAEGTATLLAARFYDFVVVALLLASALLLTGGRIPAFVFQASLAFCILVFVGAAGILLFLRSPLSSRKIETKNRFASRVLAAWSRFVAGLREIQSREGHTRIGLLTLGIWLCQYMVTYSIARSLGYEISFYHISIIMLVMVPLTLLPLQGFANIGTHELGWTSAFLIFGYSYDASLAIAVGSHFFLLAFVLFYGTLSLIALRLVTPTGQEP
ncbi:MAG: lysylphosphatidylglycerol synthase transmembrane domain-containing protein [Chloroflexota bacterium]